MFFKHYPLPSGRIDFNGANDQAINDLFHQYYSHCIIHNIKLNETIQPETLEAKLRNQLGPIYGLADVVLAIDKKEGIKEIAIKMAKQVMVNKDQITVLLEAIEAQHQPAQIKRPLSEIMDEDAIELATIYKYKGRPVTAEVGRKLVGGLFDIPMSHNGCLMAIMYVPHGKIAAQIYQYLQLKNYDLPIYYPAK